MGMILLGAAAGCAKAPAKEGDADRAELGPELKALVLDSAPSDIANPLYVDFNGKAELLGYALEPALASPGSKLSLKLYWRSTGALGEGYVPFTELVTPNGRRIEINGTGPVRKGELNPSRWEPGKVYVDELDVAVPADIDTARVSIVVGIKTEPVAAVEEAAPADAKKAEKKPENATPASFGAVYLSVLSGPADDKHGGVIATLETGVTAASLRARAAKDDKRAPGAAKRAPGAGKLPISAKPRPAASAP
jgi:hypothetical protein